MKNYLFFALILSAAAFAQSPVPASTIHALPEVRRIYVAELTGEQAASLRDLIIASLDSTKLFVLTDNPDRADTILKGAADDHTFEQTLDIQEGISTRQSAGKGTSGIKSGGTYGGLSVSDTEYHHSKERKHESYAAVRLVNRDGDVLWSTTQESQGAKFRGASADVAAKIAHQLSLDYDRARRPATAPDTGGNAR
ncbi:MAG TPA: hypothetical protein VKX25_00515 [Bryobacteraceae bacterium]|jgi:hypothetical protein|nr:hypothetical protein [Bryobacteraceae bacterium]